MHYLEEKIILVLGVVFGISLLSVMISSIIFTYKVEDRICYGSTAHYETKVFGYLLKTEIKEKDTWCED